MLTISNGKKKALKLTAAELGQQSAFHCHKLYDKAIMPFTASPITSDFVLYLTGVTRFTHIKQIPLDIFDYLLHNL